MNAERRRKWILMIGVAMMFLALFAYVATLDESDPDALSESAEQLD